MRVDGAIHIEAPPNVVWAVTEDVERWPQWTPTVTSVRRVDEGPFGLGSAAIVKQPTQPEAQWVVTEFASGRRFVWETRRRGLHMTGTHELSGDEFGTINVLRVEAKGTVAVMLWPLLRVVMRRALSAENRGLKARCESLRQAQTVPGMHVR